MNTYQILTFTLLLTATPLSPAQTEEKKGKFGWLEYSQPETLHKVEIISKHSALNAVSAGAGFCGIALICKGIDAAITKDKDQQPTGVQLNAASILYITTGALITLTGYLGIRHSDTMLDLVSK